MHTDKSSRIILDLYSLDLFWDFRGFASAYGTPFYLANDSADDFSADISPLSFSPEGEMQVTPLLS